MTASLKLAFRSIITGRWYSLANLVAWPLAWLYLDDWLQNFAYRIDLSWLHFLVPGLLALLIAWITVAGQALKVATDSPIKALRYE